MKHEPSGSGMLHGCHRYGWTRTANCSANIQVRCHELPQNVAFMALYEAADTDGKGTPSDCTAPELCATHLHERIVATRSFAEGDIDTACREGFLAMEKNLETWRCNLSAAADGELTAQSKAVRIAESDDDEVSADESDSSQSEQGDWDASDDDEQPPSIEEDFTAAGDANALLASIARDSKEQKKQLQKLAAGCAVRGAATATAVLVRSGKLREAVGQQRVLVAHVGNAHGVLVQGGAWGEVTEVNPTLTLASRSITLTPSLTLASALP